MIKRILVAIAVGAAAMFVGACSNAAAGGDADTFTFRGEIELTEGFDSAGTVGGRTPCEGDSTTGYDDMTAGAPVRITDAAGAVIALGSLNIGAVHTPEYTSSPNAYQAMTQSQSCRFSFSVPDVPAGHDFYGVEVASRGVISMAAAEAQTIGAQLTLGS